MVCARAVDSTYLSSDLYCFTFLAGFKSLTVVIGSGSSSGALSAAILSGTNRNGRITRNYKFNMNITRPTESCYIVFYHSDDTKAFRIDVSTSSYVLLWLLFSHF